MEVVALRAMVVPDLTLIALDHAHERDLGIEFGHKDALLGEAGSDALRHYLHPPARAQSEPKLR